jgi:hypothetical protein
VNFQITRHAGFRAPADALDLLWEELGVKREQVSFRRSGREIRATWGQDAPVTMERDEREEIGRRVVLAVVYGVCEGASELQADWFAVSAIR